MSSSTFRYLFVAWELSFRCWWCPWYYCFSSCELVHFLRYCNTFDGYLYRAFVRPLKCALLPFTPSSVLSYSEPCYLCLSSLIRSFRKAFCARNFYGLQYGNFVKSLNKLCVHGMCYATVMLVQEMVIWTVIMIVIMTIFFVWLMTSVSGLSSQKTDVALIMLIILIIYTTWPWLIM